MLLKPYKLCVHVCEQVLQDIQNNQIKIYEFPDGEGDAEEMAANKKMKVCVYVCVHVTIVCVRVLCVYVCVHVYVFVHECV